MSFLHRQCVASPQGNFSSHSFVQTRCQTAVAVLVYFIGAELAPLGQHVITGRLTAELGPLGRAHASSSGPLGAFWLRDLDTSRLVLLPVHTAKPTAPIEFRRLLAWFCTGKTWWPQAFGGQLVHHGP